MKLTLNLKMEMGKMTAANSITLRVGGMTCGACVASVENVVSKVEGVVHLPLLLLLSVVVLLRVPWFLHYKFVMTL